MRRFVRMQCLSPAGTPRWQSPGAHNGESTHKVPFRIFGRGAEKRVEESRCVASACKLFSPGERCTTASANMKRNRKSHRQSTDTNEQKSSGRRRIPRLPSSSLISSLGLIKSNITCAQSGAPCGAKVCRLTMHRSDSFRLAQPLRADDWTILGIGTKRFILTT